MEAGEEELQEDDELLSDVESAGRKRRNGHGHCMSVPVPIATMDHPPVIKCGWEILHNWRYDDV